MIKRLIRIIFLLCFFFIISCDNDDFVSPYDPSYILPAPSNLQIEQIAVNKCKLSWYDNSQSEEGFKISRKKDGEDWVANFATVEKNSRVFVDNTALPNTTFKYRIIAFSDEYSTAFVESSILLNFPQPKNLQINRLSVSTCKLTWEDVSQGEEGYKIARKKDNEAWVENFAVLSENSQEFVDATILPYSTYYYRVSAYYQKFYSAHVGSSLDSEFPGPDNLEIIQLSLTSCKLTWQDNSEWEEGFKIAKKKDGGVWVENYAVLSENCQEFVDDSIVLNSIYYYRISAYYQKLYSAHVGSSIDSEFPSPDNLQVTQISAFSCKLTWGDNSQGENGFKIARKKEDGAWVENYAVLAENCEKFVDGAIAPDYRYYYRISAYYQNIYSAHVGSQIDTEFPGPDNLQITQLSITSCKLTWVDNCPWEEGFKIARRKNDEAWVENYAVLPVNSQEFVDGAIALNSIYYYRISAYYQNIYSPHVGSQIDTEFPGPDNLQITQQSLTSCKLTWNDNNQWEEGYKIARKKDDEAWVENYAELAQNSEEFVDNDYNTYSNYFYRVSAFYQEIISDFAEMGIMCVMDRFVLVPGGTFTMGRTNGEGASNELPTQQVTLSPFCIGKYEVTQAEYQAVIGINPSCFLGADKPVETVTWYNAVEYCNALSIQEDLTPCYDTTNWTCDFSTNGYRLPTEAEWEYAARGATNNPDYLFAGSNYISSIAWHDANSGDTTNNVGTKAPNGLDIYDMSGNVWEWCNDWYGSYSSSPQTDPVGANSGSYRMRRGGSWNRGSAFCRVAFRNYNSLSNSYNSVGFRVVRRLN